MSSRKLRGLLFAEMFAALVVALLLCASANARHPVAHLPSPVPDGLPFFSALDEASTFMAQTQQDIDTDFDFRAVVVAELQRRKPDISEKCSDCIVPLATSACKTAWKQLMGICDKTKREDVKAYCEKCKEDPSIFLLERVLRAKVNPIDAGYQYCWWRSKCSSSKRS